MIISEDERDQLNQLTDSDHQLHLEWEWPYKPRLSPVPTNRWAFDQVADWRLQHPEPCEDCKKAHTRWG